MPDLPPGARVERVTLIGNGDIHDPFHNHRRYLETPRVRNWKHPPGGQPRDVVAGDAGKSGVAIPAGIAVVRGPVLLGGHLTETTARAPQQMNALVIGSKLQIIETFAEHEAVEGLAGGGLNLHANLRALKRAALNRAQEADQIAHLRVGNLVWRHASRGQAL